MSIGNIGVWFGDFIEPLIGALRIDGVGPFLALVLLFAGIGIALRFEFKFRSFKKELDGAIVALGDFETEEEFAENFETADQYFKSRTGLSQCWMEFTESIIHPHEARPGGAKPVIRNTVRPFDFFDARSAGFVTPVLKIWPNVFVGIGLFLTFAGLIAALTVAVDGMGGAADEMQRSLVDLLRTTSAKFYTSLMALFVSIVLTVYVRYLESRQDKLFKKLTDKIEHGMVYVSAEEVAYQQLIELKEQKTQLQNFNTDLAMKIGGHIKSAVSDAMQPVVDKLTSMGENMGQSNLDAMREIGAAIAKNVQGAAGDSLGHLSDRLDSLTTVLGDMASNLSKSTGQFENDIAASLDSMKAGMQAMATELQNNASQTSDMLSAKLEKLADALTDAAGNIKSKLEEGAGQVSSELETAISKLTKATDASAVKMSAAVSDIKNSVSSMSTALETASQQAGSVAQQKMEQAGTKVAEEFSQAGTNMAAALEGGISELSSAMSGFEKSLGSASGSMQSMRDGLDSTSGSLRDASSRITTSAATLADASGKINEILQPALRATEGIQSAVRQMDEKITQSAAQMSIAVSNLEKEMKQHGDAWERHSQKFDGVDAKLGEVFYKVNQQIEESQRRMGEFVTELDKIFSEAITRLAEAVEELEEERKEGRKS